MKIIILISDAKKSMWGVIGYEVTDHGVSPPPMGVWAHPVNQYSPKSLRVHFKLNNGGYAITDRYK